MKIKKPKNRLEWLKLRNDSIGGSDIGTILHVNPYKSYYELWGEKSGLYHPDDITNPAMFFGNFLEDPVANLWQYWQKDLKTTMQNFETGHIVRKCVESDDMFYHDEHKHLSATVDRLIEDQGDGRGPGILECKTISQFARAKWKNGIPISYVFQLQHYLLVTGCEWGELAVMIDGRDFMVYHFERNETITQNIIDASQEFWGRVLSTRACIEHNSTYEEFEPDTEHSQAYLQFMKHQPTNPDDIEFGSDEDAEKVLEIQAYKEQVEELNEKVMHLECELIGSMGSASQLVCNDHITVYRDKRKTSKQGIKIYIKDK